MNLKGTRLTKKKQKQKKKKKKTKKKTKNKQKRDKTIRFHSGSWCLSPL
jgi:hypothetical protein